MSNTDRSDAIEDNSITRRSFLGGLSGSSGYIFLGKTSTSKTEMGIQTMKIFAGSEDACPASKEEGRLYFAVDTGKRFYDTGSGWQTLPITTPSGEFQSLTADTASIDMYESQFKPLRRPFDSRSRWQYAGWMKDSFEDLSEWTAVSGSVTADSSTSYMGSQSAKLSASGQKAQIETSISPTDFSKYDISIASKLNKPTDSRQHVEVVLIDGRERSVVYRGPIQANEDWIQSNMGVYTEDSNVNITDIQKIRVQLAAADHEETTFDPATGQHEDQQSSAPPEEGEIEAWVDNLRYHPRPDVAQCVLTFDDATISHYKYAFPIMQEFGFAGFASVPTQSVETGSDGNITVDQMQEMQKLGWEFGSETQTHAHTSQLSVEEVRTELEGSKRWLLENGFTKGAEFLTYPYSDHSSEVVDIASDYYAIGRSVADGFIGDGLNRASLTNPLHVVGHSVYSSNISEIKSLIDTTVRYNQTVVLNFHGFGEYAWKEMSSSDFREILQYIHEKGPGSLQVVSYSNWWNNLDQFHTW